MHTLAGEVAWSPGRGGLARSEGRLVEAERRYRAVLAIQPDFLPGRLELGRVLFEDRKDREASALFRAIRTDLAAAVETAAGVRATVDTFIAALDRRRGGQGGRSQSAPATAATSTRPPPAGPACWRPRTASA
ncbi:hypothetical protein [Sphingomonas sp. Leaf231]|uniref:hypothetical protein n=1 Tax=Sphingomonas sp. Leaf231 TaxID=1736301 RepID=UPI000A701A3F|nr:hypothetical protein [Sphingomonas sp. Leaf231]